MDSSRAKSQAVLHKDLKLEESCASDVPKRFTYAQIPSPQDMATSMNMWGAMKSAYSIGYELKLVARTRLKQYHQMNTGEICSLLCVSRRIFRKTCKKLGLTMWPSSRISRLDMFISHLEWCTSKEESERMKIRQELQDSRKERFALIKKVNSVISHLQLVSTSINAPYNM